MLPPVRAKESWRFGVGVPILGYGGRWLGQVGAGWTLNWQVDPSPEAVEGVQHWQVVRLSESGTRPAIGRVAATARRFPGMAWIIGNEPDVRWQDNVTPERYAEAYGELYRAIKAADPSAHVVAGGVTQGSPLRLEYLDRVLTAYEAAHGAPMPLDAWAVHAFVLREQRDSWGVDIPPGLTPDAGLLYEVADHDNRQYFQEQIIAFRRWMAERGYRGVPLVVSEYGILMPSSYGFPDDSVARFLTDSFDFFLNATDPAIGYPDDGDRLVQRWCWYSMADEIYPTGNLVDPTTGQLTVVGRAYRRYVEALP